MNSARSCVENGEKGDAGKKGEMNPGKVAVGAREVVELRLLAVPENAEGEEAHEVHDQPRRESDERGGEPVLGMDGFARGDTQVKHQERHGEGEKAIAQSGKAIEVLVGDLVIERRHKFGAETECYFKPLTQSAMIRMTCGSTCEGWK